MSQSTGWRALAPAPALEVCLETVDKKELLRAARDAGAAMDLRASTRALLKELAGFFAQLVNGRALVWPSNDVLVERTGLSERQVRYSLRELILAGLVSAKDSANGKRFAIRSQTGQIVDAFGLDLSPLLVRYEELKVVLERKRSQRAADKRLREEVTIIRRTLTEALNELPCESLIRERTISRIDALSQGRPEETIEAWRALKDEVFTVVYPPASGGSRCRHIDTNNDDSDQSCHNGKENGEAIHFGDLLKAVPGALEFVTGPVRSEEELMRAAMTVRGAIGAHPSVWTEAVGLVGRRRAAATVLVVAELYGRDVAAGTQRIRNAGGYLRTMVRLIAEGRVSLAEELRRLTADRRSPASARRRPRS